MDRTSFFIGGVAVKLRLDLWAHAFEETAPLYAALATGFAGPLLVYGSSRYLVPLLPLVSLFQAYAAVRLIRWMRARLPALKVENQGLKG